MVEIYNWTMAQANPKSLQGHLLSNLQFFVQRTVHNAMTNISFTLVIFEQPMPNVLGHLPLNHALLREIE